MTEYSYRQVLQSQEAAQACCHEPKAFWVHDPTNRVLMLHTPSVKLQVDSATLEKLFMQAAAAWAQLALDTPKAPSE